MHHLFGQSQLLNSDERLSVLREGTALSAHRFDHRHGKPVKRAPIGFTIWATVQPMGMRDLMLMAEGDRYRGFLMLWQPKIDGHQVLQTNDKVLREGIIYQVQSADDWGSYVEAKIVRLDTRDADDVCSFAPLQDAQAAPVLRPYEPA